MKKLLRRLGIVFLVVYALFVGMHVLEIRWSPQITILFTIGLTMAVIAHTKRNYIVVIILILHMGIEWMEWSHKILDRQQIVFNVMHAVMDFVFLWHELKVHAQQYRNIIISGVMGLLTVIFISGQYIPIGTQIICNLEPFVIGGVLGCIMSHLYFRIKKE